MQLQLCSAGGSGISIAKYFMEIESQQFEVLQCVVFALLQLLPSKEAGF